MKRLAMIVTVLLSTACAREEANGTPATPIPAQPVTGADPAVAEGCALTVSFGSYAMGIDRPAYAAIDALLAGDAAVIEVERTPWGREGEVTLCAKVRTVTDAKRLFHAITPLLPAKPRGPITVTTPTGLSAKAPHG